MNELISYNDLSINHTLWMKPGGFAGIGTEAAPDPKKKPPTLVIDGSLQVGGGAAITSFSTDASFSDSGNAVVPTQLAVQKFVTNALASRAPLAGSSTQDFSTQNLSVSGSLVVSQTVTVSQSLSVGQSFSANGPVELFGGWTNVATLNLTNQSYQNVAPSDGLVTSVPTTHTNSGGYLALESPEGSVRSRIDITRGSLCVPVRKGDAWKISLQNPTGDCSVTVTWLGLGLGSNSNSGPVEERND